MSYTNVITGGSSVERVGNPSFDDQLADLQEQIDEGGGGGSVPTGTGLRHVTDGVEDGTAYSLSAADIPNLAASKITTGQLALARGGTNADLSATGGTGQVLKQTSAGGAVTVAALTAGDIPALAYKGISCGKTSDQSVSGDTATDITFTTEIIAETADLSHSTSSNPAEVTANTTQNYRIRATIVFAANGTGSYFTEYVSVLVGGTEKHRVPFLGSKPGVTQPHHFSVDIDLPVTAAQVIKLQMYSSVNGGSVLGQTGGVNQTILSITPLGA